MAAVQASTKRSKLPEYPSSKAESKPSTDMALQSSAGHHPSKVQEAQKLLIAQTAKAPLALNQSMHAPMSVPARKELENPFAGSSGVPAPSGGKLTSLDQPFQGTAKTLKRIAAEREQQHPVTDPASRRIAEAKSRKSATVEKTQHDTLKEPPQTPPSLRPVASLDTDEPVFSPELDAFPSGERLETPPRQTQQKSSMTDLAGLSMIEKFEAEGRSYLDLPLTESAHVTKQAMQKPLLISDLEEEIDQSRPESPLSSITRMIRQLNLSGEALPTFVEQLRNKILDQPTAEGSGRTTDVHANDYAQAPCTVAEPAYILQAAVHPRSVAGSTIRSGQKPVDVFHQVHQSLLDGDLTTSMGVASGITVGGSQLGENLLPGRAPRKPLGLEHSIWADPKLLEKPSSPKANSDPTREPYRYDIQPLIAEQVASLQPEQEALNRMMREKIKSSQAPNVIRQGGGAHVVHGDQSTLSRDHYPASANDPDAVCLDTEPGSPQASRKEGRVLHTQDEHNHDALAARQRAVINATILGESPLRRAKVKISDEHRLFQGTMTAGRTIATSTSVTPKPETTQALGPYGRPRVPMKASPLVDSTSVTSKSEITQALGPYGRPRVPMKASAQVESSLNAPAKSHQPAPSLNTPEPASIFYSVAGPPSLHTNSEAAEFSPPKMGPWGRPRIPMRKTPANATVTASQGAMNGNPFESPRGERPSSPKPFVAVQNHSMTAEKANSSFMGNKPQEISPITGRPPIPMRQTPATGVGSHQPNPPSKLGDLPFETYPASRVGTPPQPLANKHVNKSMPKQKLGLADSMHADKSSNPTQKSSLADSMHAY